MTPGTPGRRPGRRHGWWLWLILLTFPGPARGAEFTALMMVKDGDKVLPGKIYIADGKMRQEFTDETGQTITIVRPDKKVVWVIIPHKKCYMEVPLKAKLPGQFIQIPPDALSKRQVGTETVNGYAADKYEVMVRGGDAWCDKQIIWVAPKLGVPVKMVCRERNFSQEYKSIREGKVPERLFNLPPGYQKLTSPAGFGEKLLE